MKNLYQSLNKFAEYLFYALVLIIPFQTRWIIKVGELSGAYFEYGTISLYAVDVMLVFLILIVLYLRFTTKFKTKKTKLNLLWILIGAIEITVFISSLLSSNLVLSLFVYLRLLLGLGLFWLLTNFEYNFKRLVIVLMAGVVIQGFIGISQFGIGESFSSTMLGMASHHSEDLGASVVEVEGVRHLRAYGSFDHPNMLGGFLAISLLFFILVNLGKRNFGKGQIQNTLFNISFIIGVASLFFTFSRSSWIAFSGGLLIILFLSIIRRDLNAQKKILQFILLVGIMVYGLFLPFENLVNSRFSQAERLEQKSVEERISYIGEAKEVIRENPMIGVGMGNYSNYIYEEIDSTREVWDYQPVHNSFLLIWAEIGVIGLLLIVGVFQVLFLRIVKKRKELESKEVYKLSIIIAFLILLMLDHWLWSLHFGMFWFWFVVGLLCIKFDNNSPSPY